MISEVQVRREIAEICLKMYQREYITATDGNVSARLSNDQILITPSGMCKGDVTPEDVIRININGEKISGWGKPSSETNMHLEVYRQRNDVQAVIHAHPATAVAFTLVGKSLAGCVIPEVVLTMGSIQTVDYATPGTGEAALVIREHILSYDALILDRHGSLTVGPNLTKAYHHLEKLEHAAKVTFMAHQLGSIRSLPNEEVQRLVGLRQKFGITVGAKDRPAGCNECGLCDFSKK